MAHGRAHDRLDRGGHHDLGVERHARRAQHALRGVEDGAALAAVAFQHRVRRMQQRGIVEHRALHVQQLDVDGQFRQAVARVAHGARGSRGAVERHEDAQRPGVGHQAQARFDQVLQLVTGGIEDFHGRFHGLSFPHRGAATQG